MIDKVHFGKRLSLMRKNAALSQAGLAEKLGVTSQAVSKWECAVALPDLELLLELSRFFGVSINEMLEGGNLLSKIMRRNLKISDIAYSVPETERGDNAAWAEQMIREKWIDRNWKAIRQNPPPINRKAAQKINAHGGVILETGAGPGGGYMPFVLLDNPDAAVIVSDLSPTVVREWKKLLDRELHSPIISYIALDNCDMPFKDSCIDVVSDGGGILNTEGDRSQALREVYRILKPGGLFVTGAGFVTQETLKCLPPDAQKVLLEKRPDVFKDLYEETVVAGFKKIDSIIGGCWYTDDDDSLIADLARSLGVNLKFTSYLRVCIKEA